jgi:hypothetical protein
MAVGHGPQQDGSWPMEDRTAGASLGSLPGVKPAADRGCRETDATLLNRDSPFVVAATTMWEIESQAHPLPLGGRVLSIAHRGLSTELAVICQPNLSESASVPQCAGIGELFASPGPGVCPECSADAEGGSRPAQGRDEARRFH